MTIGNDVLPGIITDVESLPSVSVSDISQANVALVGSGDTTADADVNEPYTITRPTAANRLFGPKSQITGQVLDALEEGAMPVYAVMADETTTTKDIGSLGSDTGTVDDAPMVEDASSITITVDSTDLDVVAKYGNLSESVDTDTAAINVVTGEFLLPDTPSTSGTIEYQSLDYTGALEALETEEAEVLDVSAPVASNATVADKAETVVNNMEGFHQFAIAVSGATPWTDDTSTLSSSFDNSRVANIYPPRNDDWESTIGGFVGVIGDLGLNGSVMNKRLSTHSKLSHRLTRTEKEDLVGENIIPLASETQGALIVDDITAVGDDNAEEASMDTVFNRLVIDHVTSVVKTTEEPFIGQLNKPAIRGALQALINAQLSFLESQDAIESYNIEVRERDANTAFVDVGIETIEPLRNIYNTISAGRIN